MCRKMSYHHRENSDNHLKNLQWYEHLCYPIKVGDESEV